MKITLAQINPLVGDLPGNVERCLIAIMAGKLQGADLVVLPELALPGALPRDILYDDSFVAALAEALKELARQCVGGPPAVLGTVWPGGPASARHPMLYNAAVLLHNGTVRMVAGKRLLRADDVYHEPRWFIPANPSRPIPIAGQRVGFVLGDDLWDSVKGVSPAEELVEQGAEVLVCLAASPYRRGAPDIRPMLAPRLKTPIVYVNLVGGSDELIYDGSSFALNAGRELLARSPSFEDGLHLVDLDGPPESPSEPADLQAELFAALSLGVRDFMAKNHLRRAVLGISGGVDSAVTAAIACAALGPEQVTAVSIPSRYTDPRSVETARQLCHNLGCAFEVVELEPLHHAAESSLGALLSEGTGAENIQARLRAMILMSYVNRYGGLLLNTTNKTELCVGYITLYGDMAGMLSPLGDLNKLEIFALARWLNRESEVIPQFILDRPPTAELRPGQVDPFDYAVVTPQLDALVAENRSSPALCQAEYKRQQMGVILKVSGKAFGSGRLFPITRR